MNVVLKTIQLVARLTACALLGISLVVMPVVFDKQHPKSASLVLFNDVLDLGTTPRRQQQNASFRIRNAGTRRLVLNEVGQACHCGNSSLRTILVAPGETATVDVPGPTRSSTGLNEQTTSFTTNDPSKPRLDLKVRAMATAEEPALSDLDDDQLVSVLVRP